MPAAMKKVKRSAASAMVTGILESSRNWMEIVTLVLLLGYGTRRREKWEKGEEEMQRRPTLPMIIIIELLEEDHLPEKQVSTGQVAR